MTSEVVPVGREVAGLRHPATTDVARCGRATPLLPCPPCHLPRRPSLPRDANPFGAGRLEGRRISDRCRSVRGRTLRWSVHPLGFQRRLGATLGRPLGGGMSEGSSGRLHCPGRGGLNRRAGTRRGARTKLGGPEAHSRELAACVQNRIDMRNHALQYRPKTIHCLV